MSALWMRRVAILCFLIAGGVAMLVLSARYQSPLAALIYAFLSIVIASGNFLYEMMHPEEWKGR